MKLSTKSRYGLKVMYHLGKNITNEPMSLHTLSALSGVTAPYLEKLLGLLKKGQLVMSTRGINGGYALLKTASDISLGEIINALEDNILEVDCISKCKNNNCPNRDVFSSVYEEMNAILNHISLQNIIDKAKKEEVWKKECF